VSRISTRSDLWSTSDSRGHCLFVPKPTCGAGCRRSDRFCVRECYLPIVLSHLHLELLHMIRTRPLVSLGVCRDRYSVGYSPIVAWAPGTRTRESASRPPSLPRLTLPRHAPPRPAPPSHAPPGRARPCRAVPCLGVGARDSNPGVCQPPAFPASPYCAGQPAAGLWVIYPRAQKGPAGLCPAPGRVGQPVRTGPDSRASPDRQEKAMFTNPSRPHRPAGP
jgi:hypothetical protein